MNELINRNEDFSEELYLKNHFYSIDINCLIDEDCDMIDVEICFEQYKDKNLKIDKIINNSNGYHMILSFYTKDKSKLKAVEQEMLNIVYDKINDFINSYINKIKPYKDLLNNEKYYRDKKLSRILNDPTEVVTVTSKGKMMNRELICKILHLYIKDFQKEYLKAKNQPDWREPGKDEHLQYAYRSLKETQKVLEYLRKNVVYDINYGSQSVSITVVGKDTWRKNQHQQFETFLTFSTIEKYKKIIIRESKLKRILYEKGL